MNRREVLKSFLAIALTLSVAPTLAIVATPKIIEVHPNGPSLYQAIEISNPGDIILLSPGTYQLSVTIDYSRQSILLGMQ